MSSRARVRLLVAAAAIAAAAAAAAVAWTARADEPAAASAQPSGPRPGAPPLELSPLVDDKGLADALGKAEQLYAKGERKAAASAFEAILAGHPDSLDAIVGAAVASWPQGATERLEELAGRYGTSALVLLELGLTYLWERRESAAQEAWREALQVEPDSAAAISAESLLHPELPPGRPFFVPRVPFPAGLDELAPTAQLDRLRADAERTGEEDAWLLYGAGLQRAGEFVSAAAAFDRAAAVAPDSPAALTAAALGRFTKDDPSAAFSQLGPLAERFPRSSVVRFHLGLGLLWLRSLEEARRQLTLAAESEPGSVWAEQATQLLGELEGRASDG